jgi:hypothetical protein
LIFIINYGSILGKLEGYGMKKGNDIKFISSKENGISFIKNTIKDVEKSIKKGNISDIIYLNNLYNALSNISK